MVAIGSNVYLDSMIRMQVQHGGFWQHLQAWANSCRSRLNIASEISLDISIDMPLHLITATGLENEVHGADSGDAAIGIETSAKDTSVAWATAGTCI